MKKLLAFSLLCAFMCLACARLDQFNQNMAQSQQRDAYVTLCQKYYATDNILEITRLGSALIISCLYYAPPLEKEAQSRFAQLPFFLNESIKWPRGQKIFVGIFSENFREEDFLKNKRFVPYLKIKNGTLIPVSEIKPYGRASKFIKDFFPVFNHWEHVFLLSFDTQGEPLEFVLKWAGGEQRILMK